MSTTTEYTYEPYVAVRFGCSRKRVYRGILYSTCIVVCASSIVVSCYIYIKAFNNDLQNEVEILENKLNCWTRDLTSDEKLVCKAKFNIIPAPIREEVVSRHCLGKEHVKEYINEKIKNQIKKSERHLATTSGNKRLHEFASPPQSSRFIVYFAASSDSGENMKAHDWNDISELSNDIRNKSITGNADANVNGAVKIPQNGIFMVNAKLSVKCLKADKMMKRVQFEVRLYERFDIKNTTIQRNTSILHGVDSGVCNVKGDLLTMYQSGLMRISKNNLIVIRVKLPEHVALSDINPANKTNLGVTYVGLN